MSRLQLAVNVSDLESSITFYSRLLSAEPSKVRPGYANFSVDDPPLKLVLIEQVDGRGNGVVGALNHLGVEVGSAGEVADAASRLSGHGMTTDRRENTTCCYALQDKVWVDDPDHVPWEIYTVLADVEDDDEAPVLFGEASAAPATTSKTHCC